jgi:hypothetical protein
MNKNKEENPNLPVTRKRTVEFYTNDKSKIEGALIKAGELSKGKALKHPVSRALSNLFKKVFGKTTVRLREEKNKTEEEIQELNDIGYEELDYVLETLEEAEDAVEGNSAFTAEINSRKEVIVKERDEFATYYTVQYGHKPIPKMTGKQAEYSNEELAVKYVEYTKGKNKVEPSQSELSDFFNISQSTWSRVQKSSEFWEIIANHTNESMKELLRMRDFLVDVHRTSSDKADKIRFERRKSQELQLLDKPNNSIVAVHDDDTILRINNRIDIELEIKRMTKTKLVETVRAISPVLSTHDLEMMDENGLRILLLALSLSN